MVDDELKSKSDQLFKDLGTDTTSAIRMFLTQAVANNGFPFEIKRVEHNPYAAMSEEKTLRTFSKVNSERFIEKKNSPYIVHSLLNIIKSQN
ncbi:MAG: type II toxin-antitoxin system RelB/DinJ family antitoxin [Lachnospiraceae bacterium]